jgi:hypothetical protein
MPRKYTPTPEQRDERVNTDVEPEELIRRVLKAGPHPKDDDEKAAKEP